MASGLGVKRRFISDKRVSLKGLPRNCGSLFLDSGAHSLYNKHTREAPRGKEYTWYLHKGSLSKPFKKYLDKYAKFVKKYLAGIDYYVNVDAIFNPEISWMAQKYLEDQGINPIPVIHHRTPMRWIERHLKAGYKFLGIGGVGQKSNPVDYTDWGDQVFNLLCDTKDRLPLVRTHGFAMSSYSLMIRYPWWSVDSSSWAKAAGVGTVMIPHKRKGEFTFGIPPYMISFNKREGGEKNSGQRSYYSLGPLARNIVHEWLEIIEVPIGSVTKKGAPDEYGVASQYNARAIANLRFYEKLCKWLPKWPWPFKIRPQRRFW